MKKLISYLTTIMSICFFLACSDDNSAQESTVPTIVTAEISDVSITSAVTGGTVTADGGELIELRGVCWNTTQNPTIDGNYITDLGESASFSRIISGLSPNTTYYVRAFAVNAIGTAYGQERNFTTLAAPEGFPVIETAEITNITTTSAMSGGNIMDNGGETVTSRGICWSTNRNPTIADYILADNGQSTSFASNMTELNPSTTYYVRAYATNSNGTAYGVERSFTTRSEGNNDFGDPSQMEIYLWPEGNMPATTSYQTVANSSNPDGPDFRPNMVYYPAKQGIEIKGAVLVCPGGAFAFRSGSEGAPVAEALSELGYQSFVINYRLRPYTQQEGAQDLARAVRFVRLHADYYGIQEDNIVVAGFSAGGILCGEQVLNYRGTVNGSSLDNRYVPDDLDNVSADVKGIGHIYSFYGRLSVGSTDVELFRRSNLPPTFYCWGTTDGFAGQFTANANAVEQAGVAVERYILEGWPHGYGARGNWIPTFDRWMTNLFNN